MKLKVKKNLKSMIEREEEVVVVPAETKPTARKKAENKLPPDGYTPMFKPIRFLVRETRSSKDPTKVIKQYLELSVKRFDDDEALPFIWIQMYQESDFYTGYLKGKTVYLPLEMFGDLLDNLYALDEECTKRKI